MTHLRIGVVGEVRLSTTLLAHLMMSVRRDDVLVISLHDVPRPIDAGALALDIIRADVPAIEVLALARDRVALPEINLEMAMKSLELYEDMVLPERDPLPRPPKHIRPKTAFVSRRVMRKSVLRSR